MRIVCMANGWVGLEVVDWLRTRGDGIAALFVHPEHKAKYRDQIIRRSGVLKERVYEYNEWVRFFDDKVQVDMGLSIYYGHILKPEQIGLFPEGVVNLHPSYLPYNRGAYPNVWSIIDGTPAGVTLHYMDEGVDTGDVIVQKKVPIKPDDTGQRLYERLEMASLEIFVENWDSIKNGTADRTPQEHPKATTHLLRDIKGIDRIHLDEMFSARNLINLLRARTFPPHDGAYFEVDGEKYFLELSIRKG